MALYLSSGNAFKSGIPERLWSRGDSMLSHIRQWLDDRWPFSAVIKAVLEEDSWGKQICLHLRQCGPCHRRHTGCLSAFSRSFFYVPTVDHAYNSLSYLRMMVPFGWLIHGLPLLGCQRYDSRRSPPYDTGLPLGCVQTSARINMAFSE